ncbi:MAG: hypothetical protein ACREET_11880 [Stellaceae bacterium]
MLSIDTTVAVGALSNNGEIDLTGSAAAQASLLVEPAGNGPSRSTRWRSGRTV